MIGRPLVLASALTLLAAGLAGATDDPIATRKALMQGVGGSAGISAGLLKGEVAYSPAVAKGALASFNASAHAFGDYFPAGSETGGNTTASPKIWEDRAGFDAKLAEFRGHTMAAMQAAGKDGPADAEAFKAVVQPILGSCKGCHEAYRIQN